MGITVLNPRDRRPNLRELALERLCAGQRHGLFLLLGQSQADDVDPAAADAARDENDRIERELRALARRAVEMNVEIISQRQPGLLLVNLNADDLVQFPA